MFQTLQRLTDSNRFDVVHADQLSMAGYGRRAVSSGIPHSVLDLHNALYQLAEQLAAIEPSWFRRQLISREARSLARYEASMCNFFDAVLTVTDEDKTRLTCIHPPQDRDTIFQKLTRIPICIDPGEKTPVGLDWKPAEDKATIVCIGTMFWPPNVEGILWFAKEILPIIYKQIPHAQTKIVGKSPPARLTALRADSRIKVTGYVSDLAGCIESADVFIVPLLTGEGMRVKILDAWAWGLPVVSTATGAEGIEVQEGNNILLADSPVDFAEAVISILKDRSLNWSLRSSGRAWVETKYDCTTQYGQIDKVYEQFVA
jgi:glycosyltransferase involved in cell wall biosynthesis